MKLIIPTMAYDKEIQTFRKEFVVNGGDMDGCISLRRMEHSADWIKQINDCSKKETCPSRWVPTTQFIYVREIDNKIVGVIQIRHYFNEFFEKYAGHIGYSVCHSERRKGYATQMLHDALPYCKQLGLEKVLVCCLSENEGSRKTILNNGGVYESTVYEPKGNVFLDRYWISLNLEYEHNFASSNCTDDGRSLLI